MNYLFDILQLIGGVILCGGYIPQMVRVYRTKSVRDLSLPTFSMFLLGSALMYAYAINLYFTTGNGLALFITCTASFIATAIMVMMIIHYKSRS